ALFVRRERRVAAPAVDLSVLRFRPLAGTLAAAPLYGLGLYASIFLIPLLLERQLSMTAADTGLAIAVGAGGSRAFLLCAWAAWASRSQPERWMHSAARPWWADLRCSPPPRRCRSCRCSRRNAGTRPGRSRARGSAPERQVPFLQTVVRRPPASARYAQSTMI